MMKKKQPKVSVVMSVYNRAEYAKTAINSILNQTFTDFELIIFDNGSTDNSGEVIQNFADNDERIIFIKNPQNINYTLNLIKGFKLARGEYIARMDDDDISMPERFERQVEYLDSHPEVVVLGSFINTFGNSGMKSWINLSEPDEVEVAMNFFNPICHPTVMIRKSFLEKHKLKYNIKELYAEDYRLWADIISCGGKIANLPEELLNYRCHKQSATMTSKTAKIQDKSAERTRHFLLKRFYRTDRDVRNARKSVFKYPFENNNKKKISNILEVMKKHPQVVSLSGIEKFEKRYLGKGSVIDVFFASGDDFVPHLATAITSILKNSLPSETYRFHILDGGITSNNKEKLNICKKIKDFEIEYIKVDTALFENCPLTPECCHIPKQTYYRYIIPKLKPDLEKCLYLDSDIVVEDSLSEFWNINLEDNYVAAIEELYEGASDDARRLGIKTTFNAGVLLINIKKWVEDGISDLLFQNTAKLQKSGILKWQDQDVMNYTFKDRVKFVSPRFNLQWNAFIVQKYTKYSLEEMAFAQSHPVIIHFNSCSKPWHRTCEHPLWKKYYYYRKFSPFSEMYKKYIFNKIFTEILNIFYRKKFRGNTEKIKVFGITVLKIVRKDFYKEKRLFGVRISNKFLANEFYQLISHRIDYIEQRIEQSIEQDILQNIEKKIESVENRICIPDKRVEKYQILKEEYNLIERPQSSDSDVFYQIFVDENYKYETDFEPEVILDFGANTGYSAIYFATRYPSAAIYCLESDEENYKVLCENTKNYPNIKCMHGALYGKDCQMRVVDNGLGAWGMSVCENADGSGAGVWGYTFENLLDLWGVRNKTLDIVKIDIEGSEKEVFETECGWLNQTRLMFIETHDRFRTGCSNSVLKKVLEYDFSLQVRGDNLIFENRNINSETVNKRLKSSDDENLVTSVL